MPQDRKRPSDQDVSSAQKKSRSSSSRKSSFNAKNCKTWFHEYCSEGDWETIGPEGMEKFCEDISVEPENVLMLTLAWKLQAENMGFFTWNEWLHGMSELQCDSVEKLRNKLEELRSMISNPTHFKNIYRYAYDFARDKSQRSLDTATAIAMLTLLLGKSWPLFNQFHQFLEQSKYKTINKDQWCNIFEFSRLVSPDLANYDEDGAWPVLLDEFVDWSRRQNASSLISLSQKFYDV